MIRYQLSWQEPVNGRAKRVSLVSPHLANKGAALSYLLDQKPYVLAYLQSLRVVAWDRNRK